MIHKYKMKTYQRFCLVHSLMKGQDVNNNSWKNSKYHTYRRIQKMLK